MTAAPNNAHPQPGVIAEFDSARATPRQIAASFTLDQTVPHDQPGQVSLRSTPLFWQTDMHDQQAPASSNDGYAGQHPSAVR